MFSCGFTYAFRFGILSVFCSRDLAITPSATPHPRFECLNEGTCNYKKQRPAKGGKLVQNYSNLPSLRWLNKTRNSMKNHWGFINFGA